MNQFYQQPKNPSHDPRIQVNQTQGTPFTLRLWADRINHLGRICLYLIIGLGVLQFIGDLAVSGAASENEIIQFVGQSENAELVGVYSAFSTLLTFGIYALIGYVIYNFLNLVLNGLATIIENSNYSSIENLSFKPQKNKKKAFNDSHTHKKQNAQPAVSDNIEITNDIACPVCNSEFSIPKEITEFCCPICNASFDVAST